MADSPEPLRLVTFIAGGVTRPGVLRDNAIHEIPGAPPVPGGLLQLIADWGRWETAARTGGAAVNGARLLAPLQYPGTLLAAGSNYAAITAEMDRHDPTRNKAQMQAPFLFALPTRHTIVGPDDTVVVPPFAAKVDWEVELAIVIGRTARAVAQGDAESHVFGYTILNDVTARDASRRDDGPFRNDFFSGKGIDTFKPMGPCVVPASDLVLPTRLCLSVNGALMQDGTTAGLKFGVAELVAYASSRTTLEPGDVISSGSPAGTGIARGLALTDGDVMVATIEGIGDLRNPVSVVAANGGTR